MKAVPKIVFCDTCPKYRPRYLFALGEPPAGGLGIVACVAALIILVNGLCSLYLMSAPLSRYWIGWFEMVMLIGVLLPIWAIFSGKWRDTVDQRRLGADCRIFGNLDQAAAVVSLTGNMAPPMCGVMAPFQSA